MNFSRFLVVASLTTLVLTSVLHSAIAEQLQNVSHSVNRESTGLNTVTSKIAQVPKKPHPQNRQSNNSPNLCPCHLTSAQGSACYDFMNHVVGTCRKRPCTDGFVCTTSSYATHYCFEKAKHITRVIPVGGGVCEKRKEWRTFRVPYVDIVQRSDEREKELNYRTLIRDDVDDLEPQACAA